MARAPRRLVPSASSSRTTVASVKGRLPASAFSSVDRLSLRLVGEPLARQPPPRQLFAHEKRDRLAAFDAQLAVHGLAPRCPAHLRTIPAHFVNDSSRFGPSKCEHLQDIPVAAWVAVETQ